MSKILVFEFGIGCMRVIIAEKGEEAFSFEELYSSSYLSEEEIADTVIKADGYGYDSVYIHSWQDEKAQESALATAGYLTGARDCGILPENGIFGFLRGDFTRRRMNIPVVVKQSDI